MTQKMQRGSAMLVAAMLAAILLATVLGLLFYASRTRASAIAISRQHRKQSCAESGLQLAKTLYGRTFSQWNTTYLPNPGTYNNLAAATDPAFQAIPANQMLFADLDGDNLPDVYLYIKDNYDEIVPQPSNPTIPIPNNPLRDNDQNVIVGALCISKTMSPQIAQADGGWSTPSPLIMESLLSYNNPQSDYGSQGYHGASGTGNLNETN